MKDYTVLLIQLDGNLASDVSTRCSGCPQGMMFTSFSPPPSVSLSLHPFFFFSLSISLTHSLSLSLFPTPPKKLF